MNGARAGLGRALLVVALWAGFPLLGLALVAGLLLVPIMEVRIGRPEPFGLLAGALALVVAWSLRPRFPKEPPPLALLTPDRHPELFALVREVADSLGDHVPAEVELYLQANASVGHRGRGFARRESLGLGAPLLFGLSRAELRAVLAHEYGHRHGGDVALGGWVHATRRRLAATMEGLAAGGDLLQWPFLVYGDLFRRVSGHISRAQELAADRLSARVGGVEAAAGALRWIHRHGERWDGYWVGHVVPLLERGVRPPIVEGWCRLGDAADEAAPPRAADPWDTHPPLAERLAAVEAEGAAAGGAAPPGQGAPLVGGDEAEALFDAPLAELLRRTGGTLRPLGWDEIAREFWFPLYREQLAETPTVAGLDLDEVEAAALRIDVVADSLPRGLGLLSPAAHRRWASRQLGKRLAVLLARGGGEPVAGPGLRLVLRREGRELDPLTLVEDRVEGRLDHPGWRAALAAWRGEAPPA